MKLVAKEDNTFDFKGLNAKDASSLLNILFKKAVARQSYVILDQVAWTDLEFMTDNCKAHYLWLCYKAGKILSDDFLLDVFSKGRFHVARMVLKYIYKMRGKTGGKQSLEEFPLKEQNRIIKLLKNSWLKDEMAEIVPLRLLPAMLTFPVRYKRGGIERWRLKAMNRLKDGK